MKLETLQKEMVEAMKAKNKERKDAISSLVSAVKKTAIDEKIKENIPEELVDKVVLKELKTVKEQIDSCPASRTDLLDSYKNRYAIIESFAPKLISDENEIKKLVAKLTSENNVELIKANRGSVMKLVSSNLKGKVDMKVANKVVGDMLL